MITGHYRVLRRYGMQKKTKDGGEYVLSIPYQTDAELDRIIQEDILGAAYCREPQWVRGGGCALLG
jgi:hypothetical protein